MTALIRCLVGISGLAPPRYRRCWAGLLLALASATAVADAPVLTERASIERVLRQEAVQAWIDGSRDLAYSDVVAASQWDNPVFSYGLETASRRDQNPIEQFYVLSQDVDLSGRRALRTAAAKQRLHSVESSTQQRLVELTAETRRRFFEWLLHQQRLQVTEQWVQRLAAAERVVRKRAAAGDLSGYDLRRIVRELASARRSRQAELARLQRSWQRLQALWEPGRSGAREARAAGDLLPPEPAPLEQLLSTIERNPMLRSLGQRKKASELSARAADRWAIPTVNVGLGAKTFHAPNYSDAGAVVTFSVPLPMWDRNQAQRLRHRAQAQVLDSEYRLALRNLEGEVRAAWQALTGLIRAATAFERSADTVSDELIHITERAYQGDEIGLLELLDAYRERRSSDLEALDLAKQARDARIELDRLTTIIAPAAVSYSPQGQEPTKLLPGNERPTSTESGSEN